MTIKPFHIFGYFNQEEVGTILMLMYLEPCNSGLKDLADAVKSDLIYLPKSNNYKTWYTIEVT